MLKITLPCANRTLESYTINEPNTWVSEPIAPDTAIRTFYSAAHVVSDPFNLNPAPQSIALIDWERTIAYREYLWSLGLGVAEAMDTAQRGMGLDWPNALELIRRSAKAAQAFGNGALIASGAGTDQLTPSPFITLDDVIDAYCKQCEAIEAAGSKIILMASRALAACATSPDDYAYVYSKILSQLSEPAILHWLGDMFDPALSGYWGTSDLNDAMDVALNIIHEHSAKIDGIKISLLSAEKETIMRNKLPENVRMYTGDDFNYAELIAGDGKSYSHALLGIFDAIAPAAAAARLALQNNNRDQFFEILEPTIPLSRHIFQTPTRFYKTGIVFMAYLNGHQDHFTMIGGQQSARSLLHLSDLFRLANQAGLLLQPELTSKRMQTFLALHGVHQS